MTHPFSSLAPFNSLEQTASATENGSAFGAQGYDTLSCQVEGIVTNDIVQIQSSNDGVTWYQVGSDITADGQVAIELGSRYYRAAVTANTGGGLITATFAGG